MQLPPLSALMDEPDEAVDLSAPWIKPNGFTREYLASFEHYAMHWDYGARPFNLELTQGEELSGGIIKARFS